MSMIHCIGIGGVGVSALAKWLLFLGYRVSGSDEVEGPYILSLKQQGIMVGIGADPMHVPVDAELVVYSSAVPDTHPERLEARRRGIREMNSFELLGHLVRDRRVVVVAGTHGKSTTTAMLSQMLIDGGLDPTCFVGAKVPTFPDGNLRIGNSELVVIEGDEYARHVMEFFPYILVLNNLEWDHTEIFPTFSSLVDLFRDLIHQMQEGGTLCVNAGDPRLVELLASERAWLTRRGIRVLTYGLSAHADIHARDVVVRDGAQHIVVEGADMPLLRTKLLIPGKMNVVNMLGAFAAARALSVASSSLARTVERFTGIGRRFERVKDEGGVLVISDYAHHPTAVRTTIEAAKSFYPGRRLIVCFQPHRAERTRDLFWEYVDCFEGADHLLLLDTWNMPNHVVAEEDRISSETIIATIRSRDALVNRRRDMEYAPTLPSALERLQILKRPGDIVLIMGAGDVYRLATQI